MNKRLAILFSMRISMIEKTLKFLGLTEEAEAFKKSIKTCASMVPDRQAAALETVLDIQERRLFDDSKSISVENMTEFVHPLLRDLV